MLCLPIQQQKVCKPAFDIGRCFSVVIPINIGKRNTFMQQFDKIDRCFVDRLHQLMFMQEHSLIAHQRNITLQVQPIL